MKKEFCFLEVYRIVKEIKQLFENNSKIDKVFYLSSKEHNNIYFQIYISNFGKYYLRFFDKFLYLTDKKEALEKTASTKTLFLRKKLTNARIKDFKQMDYERLAVLDVTKFIDKKEHEFNLIFELFGQNDFILISDKKVLFSHKYKKNTTYEFESSDFNIFDKEYLAELFNKKLSIDVKIILFLAKKLKLGKIYSNEICLRTSIDTNILVKDLSDKQVKLIIESIVGLKSELDKSKEAYIIRKNNDVADIVPIKLKYYDSFDREIVTKELSMKVADDNAKTYNVSYNTALSYVFDVPVVAKSLIKKKSKDKLAVVIDKQEKTLSDAEDKIKFVQKAIDDIYADYPKFQEYFIKLKKLFSNKKFDDIKNLEFNEYKAKSIDRKAKKVMIDLK